MREDLVHLAVRGALKSAKWTLIAGQFPNGSDDELMTLSVTDPSLARDNSPDHRRHSLNELVPDLLACKSHIILIIEMKPEYSPDDERKLKLLLESRIDDFRRALREFDSRYKKLSLPVDQFIFVPCLGFDSRERYPANENFCYFEVTGLSSVRFKGNKVVPTLE